MEGIVLHHRNISVPWQPMSWARNKVKELQKTETNLKHKQTKYPISWKSYCNNEEVSTNQIHVSEPVGLSTKKLRTWGKNKSSSVSMQIENSYLWEPPLGGWSSRWSTTLTLEFNPGANIYNVDGNLWSFHKKCIYLPAGVTHYHLIMGKEDRVDS
jgi:hypothetical protein